MLYECVTGGNTGKDTWTKHKAELSYSTVVKQIYVENTTVFFFPPKDTSNAPSSRISH